MSLCFAMAFKNSKYLAIVLISLFLGLKGLSILSEYKRGNIVEDVMICQNVRKATIKDRTIVTFSTADQNPRYMEFSIAGKNQMDKFTVGATYLVYYNVNDNKTLLESDIL